MFEFSESSAATNKQIAAELYVRLDANHHQLDLGREFRMYKTCLDCLGQIDRENPSIEQDEKAAAVLVWAHLKSVHGGPTIISQLDFYKECVSELKKV